MYDPRKAHTQYNDYRGEASADIADSINFTDLAQRLDIDKAFWPVGFDFFLGETCLSTEQPEMNVSIYAVDSNEHGIGIDAVNKSVLSKDGTLPVTRFSKRIPVQEFFTFFKRFHVTGFNKALSAGKVEVVQSVECDESHRFCSN
jgi:hypothetical protein